VLLFILVAILTIVGIAFVAFLLQAAVKASQFDIRAEPVAIGAVTNFFDTLGIGSFAPTLAWMRFRKLVPDRLIPMTMIAGYTPPSIVQAIIFMMLLGVNVDPLLLVGSAIAILIGGMVGAPLAARSPVRAIQLIVAGALLTAAFFYSLANLNLMPVGGTANTLPTPLMIIAILASFAFGVLLNFGVGNYAPTLAMLSLFGMDPRLAFPIMAFGASCAGTAASARLIRLTDIDLRIVLSLVAGAIPAVLIAAFVVKEMPITTLRWLVVVVVVYAALSLIYAALREPGTAPEEQLEKAMTS
jgi:uncharacterized membrane protein YfcA